MTINDIEALTFETIQGYEESKRVAKNRNTRYRTAKYMATNSKGQEHEYKVRVNNAGQPATIVDLGVTRAQVASNHRAGYDALKPETKRVLEALALPLHNYCQKAIIGDAIEGRIHWGSINAVCNWSVCKRLRELFPVIQTTDDMVKAMQGFAANLPPAV